MRRAVKYHRNGCGHDSGNKNEKAVNFTEGNTAGCLLVFTVHRGVCACECAGAAGWNTKYHATSTRTLNPPSD